MPGEPPTSSDAEVELRLGSAGSVRVVGDASDASVVGSIARHGGLYEPGLVAALQAMAARDWICLDIGANVGPISLALSRLCPDGKVHAFEPTAESFRYLLRNVSINSAANLEPHHLALLDNPGEVTINYNHESSGAAFISEHLADGIQQTTRATTLDDWAAGAGLRRLDLVKIDVEGSEERVLEGGRATIAALRPVLVVELNPITIRRMQHGQPRDLYRRLQSIYGRFAHLAVLPDDGAMVPVLTWGQLERQLAESGVCNLVCSPRRLAPGTSPGMAGRRAAARMIAGLTLRRNRFVTPAWAAVEDPRVRISPDLVRAGVPLLRGEPGRRVNLPLRIINRGRVALLGRAPRFAVSVRVVWIDAEGRHTVDDRSRTPVPTLRPGSGGSLVLPVFLPEQPGAYRLRITLFQDLMAWFYDLDPLNCCELPAEVMGQLAAS
jgi:FkbM family methyltransferase